RRIEETTSLVTAEAPQPGDNAVSEEVDNPLITDGIRARAVASWVRDWLLLRNTYEFTHRGYPEVDPLDHVFAQSQYTDKFPAIVLRCGTEFSNSEGMSGSAIVKMNSAEE
ncbi:hypothetical protein LJC60_06275, partial [Ruminococcaceae bacterium OttesenSCG-928-D13]|nr:hypothetical protein [Ruminococcaceae bacterium OttesenSCG-928-D13]